jgi:hypothetical protein
MTIETNGKRYTVVLRASAGARFAEGESLTVCSPNCDGGPVNLVIQTYYSEEGLEAPVPRGLWIEASGPAISMDNAINKLAGIANSVLAITATAFNVAIYDPAVQLAFETTPGVSEREFFQVFLPEERGLPVCGRTLSGGPAGALLEAIYRHTDRERLRRAVAQYYAALSNWEPGLETLALAHLYMGMEAITKARLRHECLSLDITEDELVATWGIEKKQLDATVRERLLFMGDNECYHKAKEASDGFEHGFLDFARVRSLASEVRDRTANYLRIAIFEIAAPNAEKIRDVLKEQYKKVIGAYRLIRQVRGFLSGEGEDLARPGHAYPILEWESRLKAFRRNEQGGFDMTPEETFTAQLADGIKFRPVSYEVWGPTNDTIEATRSAPPLKKVPTVGCE